MQIQDTNTKEKLNYLPENKKGNILCFTLFCFVVVFLFVCLFYLMKILFVFH